MSNSVPVRPAATIALLRDAADGLEVFLLRRHAGHVFAASAYVYPGGAVDTADHDARLREHFCDGAAARAGAAMGADSALGYWAAASRECFEEAGVLVGCKVAPSWTNEAMAAARDELNAGVVGWCDLVERMGLRFDPAYLHYFAHRTTPPGQSRRFSTRFFAARMPDGQHASPDGSETTHGEWIRPVAALVSWRAGDIDILPPTVATLRQLSEYADIDAALAGLEAHAMVPHP